MDKLLFPEIAISEFPFNYIPKDAVVFTGIDVSEDGICKVTGFIEDSVIVHIQEVEYLR